MDPSTLQCTHSRQPEYRQLYDLAEQNGPVTVNAQSTHLDAGAKQKIIVLNNNISAFLFLGQRITLLQQIANQGCSDCAVDLKQQAVVWLKDSEKRLAEKAILYLVTAYKTQKTYNNNTTEIKEKLSEVFNSCSCHKGNNLLHHFIEYEYFPVIDYLFDVEKEIVNDWLKEQNEEGNTPLHLAVQQALKSKKDRQKFESVIKKLLDCKANPEVKNSEGKTPLDLASKEVKAIFFTSEQFCLHHVKNQITCFYASRDREIKRSFWVDAPPLKIEECFINLSIVKEGKQKDKEKEALEKKSKREQIFGSYEDVFKTADKKPIHLKDLFESRDGKDPKKLLILGRAGIGKSTLCQYLTHLWWGNDGVWKNQFDLVVRINLRNLTRKRYRNENVSFEKVIVRECFQSTNQEEKEIQYIEKALASIPGERKLFLLDGYDEFPADSPCKTAINTLLSSQNGSYLIVTSRPYASIRSVDFDCCLECIGFTSEDIPEYLNLPGVCKDDDAKEKILAFFKQNPAIHNLAHIPILLDLFTLSSEKILALKSVTMTKLYKHIVSKIWEKYNSTQAELNPKQREKGANPKLKKAKKFLKALAFYSFLESGIVFSYDSVEKAAKTTCRWDEDQIAGQVESLMTPGFLNCYRGKTLAENQYSFPHLTIQEYFAAFYITDWLSTDRKIQVYNQNTGKREKITAWQFILKNRYNPRFQIVWHFMSGILADSNSDYLQHFFNCLLQEPKDIIGSYHTCLLIRCLEEAGIPDLENASVFTQLKESCEILMRRRDLALLDALKLSSKMVIKLEIIEWIVSILNLKNEFFGGSDEDLSIEPPNESLQNINYQAFLNAFLFFKKLVKIGHSFPEEKSIRILIDCLSESDEWINFDAVRALRAIIQSSPDLSNQIFAKLLKLCENRKTVSAAIYAIGEIGKSGQICPGVMSAVIERLYSNNEYSEETAIQTLREILSAGCSITDEDVSQLAKDMRKHKSKYARANIASALEVIVFNKPSLSEKISTILRKAITDRRSIVRQRVVKILGCIAQQQPNVANKVMETLLRRMPKESNRHVQHAIFLAIGKIFAINNHLAQEIITQWLDFASKLISNHRDLDSEPNLPNLIEWAVYDARKIILSVLTISDPALKDYGDLLKSLKSQNLDWMNWLIKITALEEAISTKEQISPSIVDDLIGIWVEKTHFEKKEYLILYEAFWRILVEAMKKSQKLLSLKELKTLNLKDDFFFIYKFQAIEKTGCCQLKSLVCQIENDLLEDKEETLNGYKNQILSYAAESGFKFRDQTISFFIKLFNENREPDLFRAIDFLSQMDLTPYSHLIELKIKCKVNDLISIFKNTPTIDILLKFKDVPQISQLIAQRFMANELAVYIDNNELCFWEDNEFYSILLPAEFINELQKEMAR